MTAYIYGSGTFAKWMREILQSRGVEVSGFLDHRPGATHAGDIPEQTRKEATVYLGIHNHVAKVLPILAHLKELGYKEIITPVEFYKHYGEGLGNRYWLTSPDYYPKHIRQIMQARYILTDQTSRRVYD